MQTILKYLLSFLKPDWVLEDYPVEVRHADVPTSLPENSTLRPIPWIVRIPNWLRMSGYGDTREEAYADLQVKFNEYKSQGHKLPRPGTKVPIQFAPMVEIAKYEEIAEDFFPKILEMDYRDALITDSTSLWHFSFTEDEELRRRIREVYGVDVSDIEDENLVQVFQRISQRQECWALVLHC